MYLLDLGARRLNLEHDVVTAIVAMETANARLATINDPAVAEVRHLLARELAELRAVPTPDLADVLARSPRSSNAADDGGARRAGYAGAQARDGAGTRRSARARIASPPGAARRCLDQGVDPATTRLVTLEEQSLRRQHLELLLFAARVPTIQPDAAAFQQSLKAASASMAQFFDASSPVVASAQAEIATLRSVNIAPPLPAVGAAARQLRRVMGGNASSP